MSVLELRNQIVDEYRDYVESCVNILDERLDSFVLGRAGPA